MRQSYTGAARQGSERPRGRRAELDLPAMRKLALLAALLMRGARGVRPTVVGDPGRFGVMYET